MGNLFYCRHYGRSGERTVEEKAPRQYYCNSRVGPVLSELPTSRDNEMTNHDRNCLDVNGICDNIIRLAGIC